MSTFKFRFDSGAQPAAPCIFAGGLPAPAAASASTLAFSPAPASEIKFDFTAQSQAAFSFDSINATATSTAFSFDASTGASTSSSAVFEADFSLAAKVLPDAARAGFADDQPASAAAVGAQTHGALFSEATAPVSTAHSFDFAASGPQSTFAFDAASKIDAFFNALAHNNIAATHEVASAVVAKFEIPPSLAEHRLARQLWREEGPIGVLRHACAKGDLALVKLVLQEAPDVNVVKATAGHHTRPLTLLSETCWEDDNVDDRLEILKLLVARKADPNEQAGNAFPALHYASKPEFAQVLLDAKANIDAVTLESRHTALMSHAEEGEVEMVRFLLDQGADPLRVNIYGKRALALTKQSDECDRVLREVMVRLLTDQIHAHTPLGNGAVCALVVSYSVMSIDELRWAKECKAAIDVFMIHGPDAPTERLQELLALATHRDNMLDGITASLFLLCSQEIPDPRVAALIELKADVNAIKTDTGESPVHKCCHPDFIGLLVQAKANVNRRNFDGNAAILIFASRDKRSLIRAMLEAKADPNSGSSVAYRGVYEMVDASKDAALKQMVRDTVLELLMPLLTLFLTKDTAGVVLSFIAPPLNADVEQSAVQPPAQVAGRVLVKARRRA